MSGMTHMEEKLAHIIESQPTEETFLKLKCLFAHTLGCIQCIQSLDPMEM